VEHQLADEGKEGPVLPGDPFLGDQVEETAQSSIDGDGGLIFLDGADELGSDSFRVEELLLLQRVAEAESFVSRGSVHSAPATVQGGEVAAVLIKGEGLRWFGEFLFGGHW